MFESFVRIPIEPTRLVIGTKFCTCCVRIALTTDMHNRRVVSSHLIPVRKDRNGN